MNIMSAGFKRGELFMIGCGTTFDIPKSNIYMEIVKKRLQTGQPVILTNFEMSIDIHDLEKRYAL